MKNKEFNVKQVAGFLSVTPSHVNRLTRNNVLTPSIESPKGQRFYFAKDIRDYIRNTRGLKLAYKVDVNIGETKEDIYIIKSVDRKDYFFAITNSFDIGFTVKDNRVLEAIDSEVLRQAITDYGFKIN